MNGAESLVRTLVAGNVNVCFANPGTSEMHFVAALDRVEGRKRFDRKPEQVVQEAILGMLPKSKLGRAMGKKLKVYKGDKHIHQAQKPEPLALASR